MYVRDKKNKKNIFLYFIYFDIYLERKRGRSAMIWREMINKEIEVIGKNWSEIKAIVPNRIK